MDLTVNEKKALGVLVQHGGTCRTGDMHEQTWCTDDEADAIARQTKRPGTAAGIGLHAAMLAIWLGGLVSGIGFGLWLRGRMR